MEIVSLTRIPYKKIFVTPDEDIAERARGPRITKGSYVKARDEDSTCLAIVACPQCGELQFISSARNILDEDEKLALPFVCKNSTAETVLSHISDVGYKITPKCTYTAQLKLVDYGKED